ncbi:MAG: YggS family pyridoxal phosphate-dependent enzyme [Chitinophagaceae bacterium]|nr:YggS family pyridoxal phosphate-dependent enzyme [Chitinophagaceae bacterium]
MGINLHSYNTISKELDPAGVTLVAVSKIKPVSDIKSLYDAGQRDFGENYVQELVDKSGHLPSDIHWHFIGHLQSNKVKYIAPFVHLVHGVDNFNLIKEVNKQALRCGRVIDILLQVHISEEETKFGLSEEQLAALITQVREAGFSGIRIRGLMGMASFSEDTDKVRSEFATLKKLFSSLPNEIPFDPLVLSMGMSGDYKIAIEEGSNMVRIGSLLFGARS